MTAKLGDIFWSEKSFTDEEFQSLLTCESHKLFSLFSKLDQSKKDKLFHFLILNNYADKTNLVRISKENNILLLPIISFLKFVSLLVEEGEISQANDCLKTIYQRVLEKNLINKMKLVSEIREKYFPLSIDFLFSEIIFYLENMMNDEALRSIEKAQNLFITSWRKTKKSKTKEEYQIILSELFDYYKDNDYRIYKKYLLSKTEYSKKEKTQLLLFGAYEPELLELIYEKMSLAQQELIAERLNFKRTKKIQPLKRENQLNVSKEPSYELDKKIKRINEKDRLNLINKYLDHQEEDGDENYILSLIRVGHFDESDNISDLIYGFYNIGYLKAVNELIKYYNNPINKLVLSELYLAEGKILDAKMLAMEVIEEEVKDLEILEWAKRVINHNE